MVVLYVACEIFFIVQTVTVFRNQPQLKRNFAMIYFFAALHMLLIRTTFYFLGGVVICFKQWQYNLFDEYFYKFKRSAFLIIVYRFTVVLRDLNLKPLDRCRLDWFLVIFEVCDLVAFNCAYIMGHTLFPLKVIIFRYNLVADAVLTLVFASDVIIILRNGNHNAQFSTEFYPFLVVMIAKDISHIYHKLWTLTNDTPYRSLAVSGTLYWTFFLCIYYMLTELIPCTAMLLFIASKVEEKKTRNEVRALGSSIMNS
eukprot:TRINITY_DN3496_c0_g2_i5.p1 TRINITY_DN3496_c0_g2~~TRINITY_DN3496_c0_g2_i5.p1  ORF type:complete len:256 (-),score=49.85 TRINITY_DN3496_c0_g2_i5:76-843(-)